MYLGMSELEYETDLKSVGEIHPSSNLGAKTNNGDMGERLKPAPC